MREFIIFLLGILAGSGLMYMIIYQIHLKKFIHIKRIYADFFNYDSFKKMYINKIVKIILENRSKSGTIGVKTAKKIANDVIEVFIK